MALVDLLANSDHAILERTLVALKGGYTQPVPLTGNLTLDDTFPMMLGLDPNNGGGRTITLDGSTAAIGDAAIHGLTRLVVNRADAAEDLSFIDALTNAIATISRDEAGLFYHDEDDGWTLVFIITGALS